MRRDDIESGVANVPMEGLAYRRAVPYGRSHKNGGHDNAVRPTVLNWRFNLTENRTDFLQEFIAGVLGWLSVTTFLPIYAQLFIDEDTYSVNATGEGFLLAAALSTIVMGMVTNLPIIVAPTVLYARRGSFSVGGILAAQFVSNFFAAVAMGSALRLSLVSHIPTALRVGAGCGVSVLISVLGGRSMGLLAIDNFAFPVITWQLVLGLLIITGSCISWPTSWPTRQRWPLLIGLPIAVTMIVYAIVDQSKFKGYSSFSPLSEWGEGTVGSISFGEFMEDGFYLIYILRTFLSIVINVTSILLILVDAICLQDMRKIFKDVTDTDVHGVVGVSKKFRLMGTLIPIMSMVGNILGVTTQAALVQTMVPVFAGARTGLASVVAGVFFLVSMLIWPLHVVLAPGHVTGALAIILSIRFFFSIKSVDLSYLPHSLAVVMPLLIIPFTFEFVDGLCIAAVMSFLCERGERMLSAKDKEKPDCELVHCNRSLSEERSLSGTVVSSPPLGNMFLAGVMSPASQSSRDRRLISDPGPGQVVFLHSGSSRTLEGRNCTEGDVCDHAQGCSDRNNAFSTGRVVTTHSTVTLHPGFVIVALVELLLRVVDEQTHSA